MRLASLSLVRAVAVLLATSVFTLAPQLAQADVETDMVPGYDLPGGDIRGFSMADPDPGLCSQACDNDNRCVGWTFVKPGHIQYYAACYLKGQLPANSVFNQNVISGVKAGKTRPPVVPGAARTDFSMMFGVDLHGADLRSFAMPSGDPAQCEAACDGDRQCAAWTFIKPGPQGPPICFLKKAVPTPTQAQHVISGAKASPRNGPFAKPAVTPPPIANQGVANNNNGVRPPGERPNGGITGRPAAGSGGQAGGQPGGQPSGNQGGGNQGGTGAGGGMAGPGGKPAGGMTGGGPSDWGVWASASGGKWSDPCAILYNAAILNNNRYDGNPGYVRVRTRATQRDADLDIDQFGLHHRNRPDGIVKLVPCDTASGTAANNPAGGTAANNPGGGSSAALVNGNYDSERGRVSLTTAGGTFGTKGGTIQITSIANTVVEGTWREPGSGSCAGGANYGRFRLIFSAEGFQGYFGYCEAANTTQWGGTRLR